MVHWTFYLAVIWLLVFSYPYLKLRRAKARLNEALKSERELALQELRDWDQDLAVRFERGDLTVMEAMKELTEFKLTHLKVLSTRVGL